MPIHRECTVLNDMGLHERTTITFQLDSANDLGFAVASDGAGNPVFAMNLFGEDYYFAQDAFLEALSISDPADFEALVPASSLFQMEGQWFSSTLTFLAHAFAVDTHFLLVLVAQVWSPSRMLAVDVQLMQGGSWMIGPAPFDWSPYAGDHQYHRCPWSSMILETQALPAGTFLACQPALSWPANKSPPSPPHGGSPSSPCWPRPPSRS